MGEMQGPAIAQAVGLRYVTDRNPGIGRRATGGSFGYFDPAGKRIRDESEQARIRALAVPPAYHDVWISPLPNDNIQATARDARGRKQYRYHPKWREVRDSTKFARMIEFAKALPRIRTGLVADIRRKGVPREKVLAAIVQLLEETLIRVGNDEYAKHNHSFGLTTLRNRHAAVRGRNVRFTFRGKSGVRHAISLRDRALAKIVLQCQEIPGQHLFTYLDDDGTPRDIDSSDLNEYIRTLARDEFSAKDFRTWIATVSCVTLLVRPVRSETVTERKAQLNAAIETVAARLGNTAAICRKCYVHPEIANVYLEDGTLGIASGRRSRSLLPRNVLSFACSSAAHAEVRAAVPCANCERHYDG